MSAITAAIRGRIAAERLMVDTCTIRRATGETTDPDRGKVVDTYTTIYSGICKVAQSAPSGSPVSVGEAQVLQQTLQLHLPASVVAPLDDDEVTIDTSLLDATLPGKVFRLRGIPNKSFLTARRWGLVQVTS